MDRVSKPPPASSSTYLSHAKKEEELKRKSDLEREKARLEREAKALFGDESFVSHTAPLKPSVTPPTSFKATGNAIPASSSASTSKGGPGIKMTAAPSKTAPPPVAMKKSAATAGFWPLGKPDHVKEVTPVVKKAGEGQAAPKKISVAKPASAALAQAASFKPAPLPEIKYADPSKSSGLPSLADWRKGITRGFDSVAPKIDYESQMARREARSDQRRAETRRRDERAEEEEENDWIVDSSSEDSEDEEDKRLAKKKRRAEDKMDKMWEELRKITGYDPRSAKYAARDKTAIREASQDEVNREERQTKALGRQEDRDEEERERRAAQLKKERMKEFKRSKGISSESSSDSDDY